jgi:Ring finger domain
VFIFIGMKYFYIISNQRVRERAIRERDIYLNTLRDVKSLLTKEQVDEKFPMTTYGKYKSKHLSKPPSYEASTIPTRSLSLRKLRWSSPIEENVAHDTCAICIDGFQDDAQVRVLTCGHVYHQHCIDPWLTMERGACPLCNRDYHVTPPDPSKPYDTAVTLPLPIATTQFNQADPLSERQTWIGRIKGFHVFGRRPSDESRMENGTM